jgi:hypothetical protein
MFSKAWQVLKYTANGFIEDNCLSRGAAIAYYTVFSLAPVLIEMPTELVTTPPPRQGGVGGVGGAGKTEGQPHASPAELATDTLGQSVRLVSDGRTGRISHASISGYATKISVKATDDKLIVRRSGN